MELTDKIENCFRLQEKQKKALRKLKLFSVQDLLFYFPIRYSHISEIKTINQLVPGEFATIYGKFWSADIKKGHTSKILRAEGEVIDETGKIKVLWFNQAYIAKMIQPGQLVELTGKVMEKEGGGGGANLYMANPEFKKITAMPIDRHDSLFTSRVPKVGPLGLPQGPPLGTDLCSENKFGFPVYTETRGITSKWFYHAINKIFLEKTLDNIIDYIPDEILKKYNLPNLKTSLIWVHQPKNAKDAEVAKKRFAFEEIFCIQLERQHDKMEYKKNKSFKITPDKKDINNFLKNFPFTPTDSQKKCIEVIAQDMARDFPMSRLLEGDVGSGKTAVAATAAYLTISQGQKYTGQTFGASLRSDLCISDLQVAYMAPTEILANQHFESFIKYFKTETIGLITGSGCKKFPSKLNENNWTNISRTQLLKWVASGEIKILIGTHSLIQKKVKFKKLALVIIDEQHRFGIDQRKQLTKKESAVTPRSDLKNSNTLNATKRSDLGANVLPHLLSMTATPIPRTLALTIYGDLDLSLLNEMPAGRKQIITEIITPDKREITYEKIKLEMYNGRQLYVICPRIFEPDPDKELALNVKSVTAEAERLRKIFPDYKIDILHSKMTKIKKEEVMQKFSENKINILCATSVVEVGVNIPNATIIIIEGAERFGLAQLHQLRGRVLRSSHQAYCFIFAETKSAKTLARLKALKDAKNGFELAELDLMLRGAGEFSGTKQWGITDLGMEAIKNIKMVEAARLEATTLITQDPELSNYPILKARVKEKVSEYHFE